MEHRHGQRIDLKGEVQIYKNGLSVAIGEVRNISLTGLFVELSPASFGRHERLEVQFKQQQNNISTNRIPAVVVYCAKDGCGLVLDTSSRQVRQVMSSMLKNKVEGLPASAIL